MGDECAAGSPWHRDRDSGLRSQIKQRFPLLRPHSFGAADRFRQRNGTDLAQRAVRGHPPRARKRQLRVFKDEDEQRRRGPVRQPSATTSRPPTSLRLSAKRRSCAGNWKGMAERSHRGGRSRRERAPLDHRSRGSGRRTCSRIHRTPRAGRDCRGRADARRRPRRSTWGAAKRSRFT